MISSLPNLLTLSRIAVIPIIVLFFFFRGDIWHWLSMALFVAAAITDFFDGYLARVRQEVSRFGRFLDPIADKLLIAAVLMMLVADEVIAGVSVIPAIVILCREILVSGLREFLAELNVGVPVSRLAKWKTTVQMVAIGFLLVNDAMRVLPITEIGLAGLWIAGILTFITGYDYFRASLRYFRENPQGPGKS